MRGSSRWQLGGVGSACASAVLHLTQPVSSPGGAHGWDHPHLCDGMIEEPVSRGSELCQVLFGDIAMLP